MDTDLKTATSEYSMKMTQNANRIALQTMKERCYLLQHRLSSVEKENVQLSLQCSRLTTSHTTNPSIDSLNASIVQLTKEKSQLAHHMFIVACENKRLWSHLSQLTKSIASSPEKSKKNAIADTSDLAQNKIEFSTPPPLARSRTFTHYKSDSKLSAKLEDENKDFKNSLEEISLKLIDSFLMEKSELVNQYEQMVDMQINCEKISNENSMEFTYLDEFNNDVLAAIRKHKEKLSDLKKNLLQQQTDLKQCLINAEAQKLDKNLCDKCKSQSKNSMDASLTKGKSEASSSDVGYHDSSTRWATATCLSLNNEMVDRLPPPNRIKETNVVNIGDNIQNATGVGNSDVYYNMPSLYQNQQTNKEHRKKAPNSKKICPMCGKCFTSSFKEFELHVENHFTCDDNFDSVNENYETVANSIGNNFN